MKRVGAHVSAAGGVENAPVNASAIGARAFGLFVKNQLQWRGAPLKKASVRAFKENCAKAGYEPRHVLAHDGYLINLGSPEPVLLAKSRESFLDEMKRCEALGIALLNFHPGTTKGLCSVEQCLATVAESLNVALDKTRCVVAVIENTAGQGKCVGNTFEQVAQIISMVENQSRVGVCLDTCHLFAAGYDLRSRESYAKVMREFEAAVGFRFLRGMHLNDSKSGLGSGVDRHRKLGEGKLGLRAFRWIMNDPRLDEIPLILETPDSEGWAEEIRLLDSLAGR